MKKKMIGLLAIMGVIASYGNTVVISDTMDNGDPATGGINGGFTKVGGAGGVTEADGILTIDARGTGAIVGAVSVGTFDAAGSDSGFRAHWDVDSVEIPDGKGFRGFYFGVQKTANALGNNDGVYFKLAASGQLELYTDTATGDAVLLNSATYTAGNQVDGFDLTATFTESGWTYSSTDLGINASGSWTASDFNNYFDANTHIAAYSEAKGTSDRFMTLDSVSVELIPEPMTLGLLGISGAGLLAIRRRFGA